VNSINAKKITAIITNGHRKPNKRPPIKAGIQPKIKPIKNPQAKKEYNQIQIKERTPTIQTPIK